MNGRNGRIFLSCRCIRDCYLGGISDKEIALIKKKISRNDRVDELVDRVKEKSLKSVL